MLNIELYDLAIPLLDTYPPKLKAETKTHLYTVFIVVLFITANRCQNRLIGKQNVTYTLNGILFSHKKE